MFHENIIDEYFPVEIEEEDIVIAFDEPQPPDVIDKAIRKEIKKQ
jgi:hypothetical protein